MNVFELFASLTIDTGEFEKNLKNAESMGGKFGSGLIEAAGAAKNAISAVVDVTSTISSEFMQAAGDVAVFGDNIDKASQKLGVSASFYQEWEAVLQHSGTSMGNMSAPFKTLAKASQDATDDQAAAFAALGMSMNEVSAMSSEELFANVVYNLQNMEEGTERTTIALQLLGRGAQELGPLFNTSAEDTQAMLDTVNRLGGVMSDEAVKASAAYRDSLQDLNTSITGMKNNIISEFLPALVTGMDGLTAVFSGDTSGIANFSDAITGGVAKISEILPQITSTGMDIAVSLADGIVSNVPLMSDSALQVIDGLITMLSKNTSDIAEGAADVITALSDGISEAVPQMLPAVVQIAADTADTLVQNVPTVAEAGLKLISGVADGVLQSVPVITGEIPVLIASISDTVLTGVPMILETGEKLLSGIISAIPPTIRALTSELPRIIENVVSVFLQSIPMMIETGTELLTGLIEAIPPTIVALTENLPQIITSITKTLTENVPAVINAGITLFKALADSIPAATIAIIEALPDIITGIISTLTENIPLMIDTGFQIFTALVEAIPDSTIAIVKAIPEITTAIINAFMAVDWIGLGGQLIAGIGQGLISGVKNIGGTIEQAGSDLVDGFKDFFGIHSPSTVFRDQIGKFLASGIGEGFTDEMDRVSGMMSKAIDVTGMVSIAAQAVYPEDMADKRTSTEARAAAGGVIYNTTNINGIQYQDFNALVNAIAEALSEMTGRSEASYA